MRFNPVQISFNSSTYSIEVRLLDIVITIQFREELLELEEKPEITYCGHLGYEELENLQNFKIDYPENKE